MSNSSLNLLHHTIKTIQSKLLRRNKNPQVSEREGTNFEGQDRTNTSHDLTLAQEGKKTPDLEALANWLVNCP